MASYTYELLEELGDEAHGLGCKCCRFTSGIDLPTPAKLSIDEIKHHGLRFSKSIWSNWTRLNAVLKRYEVVIQKRWLKKNTMQRREVLLKAWPDMAVGHRPDFAGFRHTTKTAPRSRTCRSATYLWPYINQEDLQQHHPLLLFLGSRGRNLPDKFMSADIEAAHLGRGWHIVPDLDGDFMLFLDQCTPRSYGRVLGLPKAPLGHAQTQLMPRLHPSIGLLGLEIQAGIYSFLHECAKLVLHDVPPNQLYIAPHQPAPSPLQPRRIEFRTLQDDALETPYRLPQKFDLARLTQLVAARRSSAEDHIWMLREDPGYFMDTLREGREHDSEYNHDCPGTWPNVAAKMIGDALTFFLFWNDIYCRLSRMPPLESQIKQAQHKAVRLPSDVEVAWDELDEIVDLMLIIPLSRLSAGLPISPRMRHCYPWHDKPNVTPKELWGFKPSRTEAERRVDMVFHAIADPEQQSLHGLNHLVQEAQYMLDTEPAANQLVDSWLIGHFSDLALLSEIRLRIDGLVPWSDAWRACGVPKNFTVVNSVSKLLKIDAVLREAICDACRDTDLLGDPNSPHWRYPAEKRPSKANVDQMRHAERHLDDYWEVIEDEVRDITGLGLIAGLNELAFDARTLHRTAPWKEPILQQPKLEPQSTIVLRERDLNQSRLGDVAGKICTPSKTKVKVKTRGTPASTPTPKEQSTATPTQEPTATPFTTVKVPKRTYKVLSALIPPAGAEHHHRPEIAWDELLHALNVIGLQPEKLYGSVWIFKPMPKEVCKVESLDLKRSIQFHEPKEVRRGSKIPPNMVRTFGRRLKHAFQWEAGMFECE